MRDVLVEGDLDREAQRVAAAVDGARRDRARSRRQPPQRAHVLLPLDLDDLVLELDDVDHLRALDLARQRLQRPVARRAFARSVSHQLAAQRHARQRRLLRRAVTPLLAFCPSSYRAGGAAGSSSFAASSCASSSSFSAICSSPPLPLSFSSSRALPRQHRDQMFELRLLQPRHRRSRSMSCSRSMSSTARYKITSDLTTASSFRVTSRGDSIFFPTSAQPSMKSASSLDVSRTGGRCRPPRDRRSVRARASS